MATRPLAIQKDGTWYTYGWDLTKNICEVYGQHGYIRTSYTYSPYGLVVSNGDVVQPINWVSEFCDTETSLMVFNYRYYNGKTATWLSRDFMQETAMRNLYDIKNPLIYSDVLGLFPFFGVDINIDVSLSVEGCIAPFPAAPLVKLCLGVSI